MPLPVSSFLFKRPSRRGRSAALALALLSASGAFAHVTLEQKSAEAASTYKAVFRVSHGCEGAPTTGMTVFVPPSVRSANPMPKAGWTLESKAADAAGPTRISWQGGPLADGHYDEFVMRLRLPEQPGPMWFRVLQQCEGGASVDWSEVPDSGTSTRGLKKPAALLELRAGDSAAPAAAGHHH